jgi:hypothetical protein
MSISVTLRPDDLDGYNRLIADLLAREKNNFAGEMSPPLDRLECNSPTQPAPAQAGFFPEVST